MKPSAQPVASPTPGIPERFNTIQPDLGSDPAWDHRDLSVLLSLKRGDDGAFYSPHADLNLHGAVFGGQLVGQAIAAASAQDVPADSAPHCVQVNFLTAGRAGEPMRYEVRQLMKGRQFCVQQVLGTQGERTVISANVSFHRGEPGPTFQRSMPPNVPDPDSLPTLRDTMLAHADLMPSAVRRRVGLSRSLDLRPVDAEGFLFRRDASHAAFRYWVRVARPLPDVPWIQQAALGYLSDYWFPLTGLAPHLDVKIGSGLYVASLNHTMWLHQPARADDWLLVDAASPGSGDSRGLSIAYVYARDGRLVASLAQESLCRGWLEHDGAFVAPGLPDDSADGHSNHR
jgi:acyl-CoA thioesterase II